MQYCVYIQINKIEHSRILLSLLFKKAVFILALNNVFSSKQFKLQTSKYLRVHSAHNSHRYQGVDCCQLHIEPCRQSALLVFGFIPYPKVIYNADAHFEATYKCRKLDFYPTFLGKFYSTNIILTMWLSTYKLLGFVMSLTEVVR